jgi:hypothetical protein
MEERDRFLGPMIILATNRNQNREFTSGVGGLTGTEEAKMNKKGKKTHTPGSPC